MKKVLKILLYFILILTIILFYMLYTDSGKKLSYNILSFIASQKIGLHTRVSEVDFTRYPYMEAKLFIGKKYNLSIYGVYENKKFDLNYTLFSKWIESDTSKIRSDVNITGAIKGPRKSITITGEGTALDGNISYVGIKHRHAFYDVHIDVSDINASKLFKLLGQKALFEGKASANLAFDILSHERRKGTLYYKVKDKDYHGVEVDFQAKIKIDNEKHYFTLEAKTPTASLYLQEGHYNQKNKKASAKYIIDIKNVSELKKLVKINYDAPFYATGTLMYDHKKIIMQGTSKSLEGILDLALKENKLYLYLYNIPLAPLMKKLDIEPIFDSNVTGEGIYDIKTKTIILDAKLSPLFFTKSKLTQSLLKSSGIDLSSELFDKNHLHIETKDNTLSTTLTLSNTNNHLVFKNTQFNSKNNSIKSDIDFKMYQYYISGYLYLKIDKYTHAHDTYIDFDGVIQKHYALKLKGLINKEWTSMDYTLSSSRLPSHICTIVDDVNLTGHINGPFKRLHIEGQGKALDGNISYKGVLLNHHLEDVHITANNIHGLKLSTLLGYPELPYGKGNFKAVFEYLSTHKQTGDLYYWLHNAKLFNLPFEIDIRLKAKNNQQNFNANIALANAKLTLTKGTHSNHTGVTKTFYTLDVKDLSVFEALLGYKYRGALYAVGTGKYDGDYYIHGLSKTFGGYTEYLYDNNTLTINLDNTSFKRIMSLFEYPAILDAETTGKIEYQFETKKLSIKTQLKNTKFFYHEEMDTLYQKSGINLLKEVFPKATLDVNYDNDTLLANLIMDSNTSHLSLTNTHIDTKLKTINGYFDIKMQGKEFMGKVYGPLQKPKINLNMQKLIRHEMDRQLDSVIGEGNRKMMENMPMGGVAKDMASEVGGAFMGIFF